MSVEGKMFTPKRCIIIGSGYSVKEGIEKGLWDIIQHEFTVTMNYAYRYFDGTVHTYADWMFYKNNKNDMDKLPLIISPAHAQLIPKHNKIPVQGNTFLLKRGRKTYMGRNSLTEGIFPCSLNGLFTLTTFIALGFTEIYLLGYDFGATGPNDETHFYQGEITHRGVGMQYVSKRGSKVKAYNTSNYSSNPEKYFKIYEQELNRIQIINVSPNSRIETFPKMDYDTFLNMIKSEENIVLQSVARQWVIDKLIDVRVA